MTRVERSKFKFPFRYGVQPCLALDLAPEVAFQMLHLFHSVGWVEKSSDLKCCKSNTLANLFSILPLLILLSLPFPNNKAGGVEEGVEGMEVGEKSAA